MRCSIRLRLCRFNPCSIGFSFRSGAYQYPYVAGFWFQSLFYWIFLSESSAPITSSMNPYCFNPCSIGFSFRSRFLCAGSRSWTFVSILVLLDFPFGVLKLESILDLFLCFNPCSIGFSFRRKRPGIAPGHITPFQSLFYWIFLSEASVSDGDKGDVDGFNPCSIGFSFRRRPAASTTFAMASFNPCSIGFSFRREGEAVVYRSGHLFQSLFYWIFLSEELLRQLQGGVQAVSILVLLDFPFGGSGRPAAFASVEGFNPCSIGFSFRR